MKITTPPKISIITIVKNGMPFIEETLLSVIKQDYKNIEYIVIDSVSTDGTYDFLLRNKKYLTHFVSEPDLGISDAFNKGFELSSGDYVMFLNSDDKLAQSNVISKVVDFILYHKFPMLIYGDYDVIDRCNSFFLYHGSVAFSEKKLRFGQVIPHPCLLASREYFNKYGKFDINFKIAMDFEWLLRGVTKESLIHIKLTTTIIRNGGVSTVDRKKVVNEILKALVKNNHIKNIFSIKFYFFLRGILKSCRQLIISLRK